MFATKVRSTCEALGVVSRPARNAAMLTARLDRVDDGKPNDAVAAVLVDLDAEDALELIALATAHETQTPVVAFGPHVAVELLQQAAESGADPVMTRGRFTAELPALIQRYASGG